MRRDGRPLAPAAGGWHGGRRPSSRKQIQRRQTCRKQTGLSSMPTAAQRSSRSAMQRQGCGERSRGATSSRSGLDWQTRSGNRSSSRESHVLGRAASTGGSHRPSHRIVSLLHGVASEVLLPPQTAVQSTRGWRGSWDFLQDPLWQVHWTCPLSTSLSICGQCGIN